MGQAISSTATGIHAAVQKQENPNADNNATMPPRARLFNANPAMWMAGTHDVQCHGRANGDWTRDWYAAPCGMAGGTFADGKSPNECISCLLWRTGIAGPESCRIGCSKCVIMPGQGLFQQMAQVDTPQLPAALDSQQCVSQPQRHKTYIILLPRP